MGTEIERKFRVTNDSWREAVVSTASMRQGYLAFGPPAAVRIRVADDSATVNIKGATLDIVRSEYEYPISTEEARAMLDELCQGQVICKTRHLVPWEGHTWEVDVFEGANEGLIIAELELDRPDEPYARPPWIGEEVSGDPRFLNVWLAQHPYSSWFRGDRMTSPG